MTTHDRPFGRHFEDFEPGDVYKHWPGKTITEYDDHLFCMITMNHHPLHTNEWFAENETRAEEERRRRQPRVLAGARHERARRERRGHRQPRDRVAAPRQADLPRRHDLRRHQGARRKETSKGDRGIVTVETKGINQRGEEVCYFRRKVMVWKRDHAPPAPRSPTTTTPSSPTASESGAAPVRRPCSGWPPSPSSPLAVLGVEVRARPARAGPRRTTHRWTTTAASARRPDRHCAWCGSATPPRPASAPRTPTTPCRAGSRRALDRPVELTSLAVSGDRVADVVDDQVPAARTRLDPDVVLVSIGANDVVHLTSRDDFRGRYDALVAAVPDGALRRAARRARHGRAAPLPPTAAGDRRSARGRQLDEVEPRRRPRTTVPCTSTSPARPARRCAADPDRYFAEDRYHPSDDGYALWAAAVSDQLAPALA